MRQLLSGGYGYFPKRLQIIYLSLQMVVYSFAKNVLVFIMVLNQLIIKVCYTFISRYFMVEHAVRVSVNVNFSWKAVLSFLGQCVNVNFSNVKLSTGLLTQ